MGKKKTHELKRLKTKTCNEMKHTHQTKTNEFHIQSYYLNKTRKKNLKKKKTKEEEKGPESGGFYRY